MLRRAQARLIIAPAIERGELPADTDVALALDLIYGPLYYRLLQRPCPAE